MRCKLNRVFLAAAVVASVCCMSSRADVFNMGGTQNADGSWNGLASLEMVTVGNPGNAGEQSRLVPYEDTNYYGAVDYVYHIGKFEVTAAQYVEFLNAVAKTDMYGLYNTLMWTDPYGGKIQRSGSSGSYTYSVAPNLANFPVSRVSWGDAARFVNWLHNGQPTGEQNLTTTEDGAYFLNGATSAEALMAVNRKPDAAWWIPSEDEWYKAAYHRNDGVTGNYWLYPTGTNDVPSCLRLTPDPGNNANFGQTDYAEPGEPYGTFNVGEFENSASPYGTFDQGGNFQEWNETAINNLSRGVRGGQWLFSDPNHLRSSNRISGSPTFEGDSYGFRVASAAVPEPGSLAMLAGIALTVLLYQKRKRA